MLWLIPANFRHSGTDMNKHLDHIGQLLTPSTWHKRELDNYPIKWGADNGCFSGKFNSDIFIKWLETAKPYQDKCLFVACPDVVGDSVATGNLFNEWQPIVKGMGYQVALVLQDGIKSIPWDNLDAVFVGGTTQFKMGLPVIDMLKEAGTKNKWRHIGRVNSLRRMSHFWGFADSFDGTDYIHHPSETIVMYLRDIKKRKAQLHL